MLSRIDSIKSLWAGDFAVRQINTLRQEVFLTFDDGPDPETTPAVLHLLEKFQARATFFVVAHRARRHTTLLREIVSRGHSLGNHSLDHHYGPFFRHHSFLRQWIMEAHQQIAEMSTMEPVGFRPPAGVVTPEVLMALSELEMSLFLWNWRFYDGVIPLSQKRVQAAAERIQAGSIVLLHDRQNESRRLDFLASLEILLGKLQERGMVFSAIKRDF